MNKILVAMFGRNEILNIEYAFEMYDILGPNHFVYIDSSTNNKVELELKGRGIPHIKTKFRNWRELRLNGVEYAKKQGLDWLLFLDADETISKNSLKIIHNKILDPNTSYKLNIDMYYNGTKLKFAGHRPRVRLLNVLHADIDCDSNNEWVVSSRYAKIGKKVSIINNDKTPKEQQIIKQIEKAKNFKKQERNKEHSLFKFLILKSFSFLPSMMQANCYFIYHYIFKLGFLDGRVGFEYAVTYAYTYHLFKKFWK